MMQTIQTQFGHPHGLLGWLVGQLMARMNRERIEWAIDQLDLLPTDHVLEIGFGPGIGIQRAAARARFVAGADVSAVMLAQASRRNQAAIKLGHVELYQTSAHQLPIADDSVDKAYMINVMHHISRQEDMLAELQRALKPGSMLFVFYQPPPPVKDKAKALQRAAADHRSHLEAAGYEHIRTRSAFSGSEREMIAVFARNPSI